MSRAALNVAMRSALPELTAAEATVVLNAILGHIASRIQNGDSVTLAGFGSFTPKHTCARTCRNPSTGETVLVPAKNTVRFKPSKALVTHK